MNLLYLSFGAGLTHHQQAAFSIYSFLTEEEVISINIITDAPDYYTHFGNRIRLITVDAQQLREWKGKHDFFWRIKIKAMEMACSLYANSAVMYLDTDTFLYKSIQPLKELLQQGKALMHEQEGPLSQAKSKTEKKMWRQVKAAGFGGIHILPTDCMWNAGVVATPNTRNNEECRLALQICDDMCAAGVTPRLIEQFALSVALQRTYRLTEAKASIGHYWGNKEEWNREILAFFTGCFLKQFDDAKIMAVIKQFDFRKFPVRVKVKSTRRRMEYLTAKAWPAQNICFIEK